MRLESRVKDLENRSAKRVVLAFMEKGETSEEATARAKAEHNLGPADQLIVLSWVEA